MGGVAAQHTHGGVRRKKPKVTPTVRIVRDIIESLRTSCLPVWQSQCRTDSLGRLTSFDSCQGDSADRR